MQCTVCACVRIDRYAAPGFEMVMTSHFSGSLLSFISRQSLPCSPETDFFNNRFSCFAT